MRWRDALQHMVGDTRRWHLSVGPEGHAQVVKVLTGSKACSVNVHCVPPGAGAERRLTFME